MQSSYSIPVPAVGGTINTLCVNLPLTSTLDFPYPEVRNSSQDLSITACYHINVTATAILGFRTFKKVTMAQLYSPLLSQQWAYSCPAQTPIKACFARSGLCWFPAGATVPLVGKGAASGQGQRRRMRFPNRHARLKHIMHAQHYQSGPGPRPQIIVKWHVTYTEKRLLLHRHVHRVSRNKRKKTRRRKFSPFPSLLSLFLFLCRLFCCKHGQLSGFLTTLGCLQRGETSSRVHPCHMAAVLLALTPHFLMIINDMSLSSMLSAILLHLSSTPTSHSELFPINYIILLRCQSLYLPPHLKAARKATLIWTKFMFDVLLFDNGSSSFRLLI